MRIETELSLFDYVVMVEDIVEDFFDDENKYCPHIGELNAMRLFYNKCVKTSEFDEKYGHDITQAADMVEIVANEEFVNAFNRAINYDFECDPVRCDFGAAYRNAKDIVDTRKSTIGNATDTIGMMIKKISESISSAINEETVNTLSQIGKDMLEGKVTADALISAYRKNIKEDTGRVQVEAEAKK